MKKWMALFLLVQVEFLCAAPWELPKGVYKEVNGDIRLVLLDEGSMEIQIGDSNYKYKIMLKPTASVRNEIWLQTLSIQKLDQSGPLDEKYLKDSKDPKGLVLGNIESEADIPMPRPLPALNENSKFVLVLDKKYLQVLFFPDDLKPSQSHIFQRLP